MAQMSDNLVLLLQRFGLQNWLSLGLGEIILAQSGNLMERTCSTWLYAIALQMSLLGNSHNDHSSLYGHTLTFRDLHGLHDSCGRLVFSRSVLGRMVDSRCCDGGSVPEVDAPTSIVLPAK